MKTLVLDIETTGLPAKNADYKTGFMLFPYIVNLAYKIDDRPTKEFIINQEGIKIPPETIAIHGITDEMADQSPFKLFDALMALFTDCCEHGKPDVVIGHNIYFDTSIIKANVLRLIEQGKCDPENIFAEIEDILHKDRRIDTMRKGIKFCGVGAYPKLSVLYSKLFNEELKGHNAKADVEATYRCYMAMKEMGLLEPVAK